MKRFDPRSLFERGRVRRPIEGHPYPTYLAELDGAKSGRKPMSYGSMWVEELATRGFATAVFRRSLAISLQGTHHRPGRPRVVNVFVARPAELWRVPAKLLEWRQPIVDYPDGSDDAYGSRLFGHTAAQTRRWQAHVRQHDGFCVYAVLTRDQRRRVAALGQRCFGTVTELQGLTLLYTSHSLRLDAYECVPAGQVLSRVHMNADLVRDLLGGVEYSKRERFLTVQPSRAQARAIANHQHANVELLTARGWR